MEFSEFDHHADIPGTTIFDGKQAMKGYALNKMCYSFNGQAARDEYLADPEAYYEKFGLNEQQKQACRDKNVLAMIEAGGNIYYLAKFAGIFKLSVQDVGAQQTGMTTEEFKQKLLDAGKR
ncbi:protocatechuate 4,5-dioxygenase subunit alpha [Actibacterium sp.]|uniref:protocatechuate 4,5-dioxygenase subunit alpha n=1 Tax=Actibacterium sp. TaxID=1872125 RepID=UPI003568F513